MVPMNEPIMATRMFDLQQSARQDHVQHLVEQHEKETAHDDAADSALHPAAAEQAADEHRHQRCRDHETQPLEQEGVGHGKRHHQRDASVGARRVGFDRMAALVDQPQAAQADDPGQQQGKGARAHGFVGEGGFDAPPRRRHEGGQRQRAYAQDSIIHDPSSVVVGPRGATVPAAAGRKPAAGVPGRARSGGKALRPAYFLTRPKESASSP
ncbi:hypothetical protein G6F68_014098 [Rhizopus microsporus]|nr:hypothetical protein G6F68_014098 [Rhizopus microsporus]